MDKTLKKVLTGYLVCMLLSCLLAYLDRNDPSGTYVTPAIRVFEILMMSLLLFGIFTGIYGLGLLLTKAFTWIARLGK